MQPCLRATVIALASICLFSGMRSDAGTITWTDWTSITDGNPNGAALGTLSPVAQPVVSITYSGDVEVSSQTSDPANFNYWNPASTFTSATVSDAPTNPGIVTLFGDQVTNTLTFSQPIVNPVMALLSLGNSANQISYTFDAPFTILSGGPSAAFNGSSVYQISPNVVGGMEGNGTIQFTGSFTSLSWTVTGTEYWHGFTLGIAGVASVPEPSSLVMGVIGLLGIGGFVLRAKRSTRNRCRD
jgi:hypothetical protein